MEKLIQNIVDQADYYLKHAGEFFPFGAVITKTGEIRPVSVLLDHERPDAAEVLDGLLKQLSSGLAAGDYLAVGIGLQVLLQHTHVEPRVEGGICTALEIRVSDSVTKPFRVMALPYVQEETGRVIFEEFLRVKES